ncbi:unnamed protein product [Gongylonema pulchrum]|uniref:Apple domain-containing protein n=1 Tax=Gongylonema pulchrum TaxID=637853 RepID=A0A3P7MR12_9BILA|nr:unnamed protein product [Gongylonema pulchrum]
MYSTTFAVDFLVPDSMTIYYEKNCFPGQYFSFPMPFFFLYTLAATTQPLEQEGKVWKEGWLAQLAELCGGALLDRQPQRVLLGPHHAILTAVTPAECLLRCFWSVLDGRSFQCRSLMYFYEEKQNNCVLNNGSRADHPESLAVELTSIVDYFGLDACLDISRFGIRQPINRTVPDRKRPFKTNKKITDLFKT